VGKPAGSKPSVESPIGGATERSVALSEACGVVNYPSSGGQRECRAASITVKAMEDAEDLNAQASKNSPAYGVRNVRIVTAGTGEALPGPATCGNM
jgi:hypothetical protein